MTQIEDIEPVFIFNKKEVTLTQMVNPVPMFCNMIEQVMDSGYADPDVLFLMVMDTYINLN